MKKRKLYRYLSLISSLIIMFGMLNASAREYDDITDISVKNQLVSQSVINNVYTSSVTFSNLKRLKSILAKEENTESEQNRALLKELGYTEEELNTIGQEEIDMLMNSSEDITVSEQYIHFDEDSNMSIISKEQYQQNVIQKEKNNRMQKSDVKSASTDSNDGNNNVTENDMKIITTAFYVRPGEVGEKGWYWIAGMFSWLDTPTYTMTDAMSLFVSESSWSQNDEDYISRMTYNRICLLYTSLPYPPLEMK